MYKFILSLLIAFLCLVPGDAFGEGIPGTGGNPMFTPPGLGNSTAPEPSSSVRTAPESASSPTSKVAPDIDKEIPVKAVSGEAKQLTLPIGVSRTLEFPFEIGPIQLTDGTILDYNRVREGDKERKLRLVPKTPGYTDMTISDANGSPKITYMIRITREDIGQVIAELEELLGDIEGLKIRPVGGTVVLDGEILLPKDMVRIIRAIDAVKGRDVKKAEVPIKNLATISKVTMNIIAERIEREIGSPEITARVINNMLFLEGTAESDFEADRAVQIAKAYLPEAFVEKAKGEGGEVRPKTQGGIAGGMPGIIDLMRERPPAARPPSQDIKITMNYVELNNDYDKTFNFAWKPLTSDSSSVKFDTNLGQLSANVIATVSSLLPKLNYEKSHGHARVLKTEQVIVKDRADTAAVVENSINLYTRITDATGLSSVQPIPVKNSTKVKAASIPGSDSIDLGIQITLNSLLGSNNGVPIVAENSLQTQITIKNGDSAALGGYAFDQALANYNRDPGASPVPGTDPASAGSSSSIIALQRSKQFTHQKQQYIIFVTPEIIRTAAAGTEDMTRKFRLNSGER